MFDGSVQVQMGGEAGGGRVAWRELDKKFRSIARRRSALDHEELGLIRQAIAVAIWREVGMVSIREYLERRMGYTPGVASERVRVAEALDAMPALERALASNELSYSAVRAITRIATRKTERAWLAACRGKTVKEIEELLAEREPGDRPESPRKPDLRLKDKTIKMPPQVEAIIRQCRAKLEAEMGERVDEHEVIEAMGLAFLRGGSAPSSAPTQIAISMCPSCKIARQRGAGVEFAISPATFERAACDAQWLGNVDGGRTRATQDVTPATRKLVRARDKDRCRVPGCRSARNIDVHHIVHREHGGSHEPENLVCLCVGHHTAHHEGTLIIRGPADALEVTWVAEQPVDTFHVEISEDKVSEVATFHTDAVLALKGLGFTKDVAVRAVREAIERDAPHDLESLIKAALRRCGSS
jgi:hypothetical protein